MLWFFLIVSLMVVAAITVLVLPMLRPRGISEDQRARQNIAIARERLARLQTQIDDGVIQETQAAQERNEIELGLLDDIESETAAPSGQERKGGWAGIVVAICIPFLAGFLYLVLGQPESFVHNQATHSAGTSRPESLTDVDMKAVVSRLEKELKQNPDNPEGWYLLGSSYMALKRFGDAARAYGKLRELVGDDPDLLVRQADALAMANDGILAGEPESLLKTALGLAPDHPVALWLAGIAAHRRGDVRGALGYWQRAEPLFADNPQSQAELRAQINQAKSQLADGGVTETEEEPPAPEDRAAAAGGGIQVHVSLDDRLNSEVTGNETLFVLARATDGPPMPLAVVRKRADALPLVVTLDDSMAMMPNMKLSNYQKVTVVAKLSRSGNAKTQSGDLIGEAAPAAPGGSNPVKVVISMKAP